MVNEGCMQGCPNRNGHSSETLYKPITHNHNTILSNRYFSFIFCERFEKENLFESLVKSNVIYPWEITEYGKIGITNFKLVGRELYGSRNIKNPIYNFFIYLKGVDNLKDIENFPISSFIYHLTNNKILQSLSIKDVKQYLPKIEHFKKYGHLCASRCAIECKYCYKCAEKLEKAFIKKQQEQKKKLHYVPACF